MCEKTPWRSALDVELCVKIVRFNSRFKSRHSPSFFLFTFLRQPCDPFTNDPNHLDILMKLRRETFSDVLLSENYEETFLNLSFSFKKK